MSVRVSDKDKYTAKASTAGVNLDAACWAAMCVSWSRVDFGLATSFCPEWNQPDARST